MTLRQKQSKFIRMLADLIIFAYDNGYELTGGDLWAKSGHMNNSNHYIRLAVDLNLFKNGEYLDTTEYHLPLGEYWESMGGAWGGRLNDGNHYSVEWNWRK